MRSGGHKVDEILGVEKEMQVQGVKRTYKFRRSGGHKEMEAR